MAASPLDGLYLFFSIPLGLANMIINVITGNQNNPNTPVVNSPTAPRMWFSQPRPSSDPTTEVIQVNFKVPLSVSEVGWDALRVGTHTEIWYQDRSNNWRQAMDESRIPVALDLSSSSAQSWYKAHFFCYPFVAKALQWRIKRVVDPLVGNNPYCVGIRNGLIRRNIYTRTDGTMGIEPQQDPLGNTFTSYIKDWDAPKAFDDDPHTYWRSMPMPDPDAVASLYLDCRDISGAAQLIDTVAIDPVYTGQNLNLYYSNDDTQGTLKLSPITAVPTEDENTNWQQGKGRWDTSSDPGTSAYHFPMAWGPLISQDAWIGIEWTPDFAAADGPAENPVLFEVTPVGGTGQFYPKIYYDVGAGTIVLELTDGTTVSTFPCALSPALVQFQPLRIAVGWAYGPDRVVISVKTPNGTEVGHLDSATTLPTLMTLDGSVGFSDFRGLFTAHVVKLENWSTLEDFNFVLSPDFEDTTVLRPGSGGYSTEQAHSGTHSWKVTATATAERDVSLIDHSSTATDESRYFSVVAGQRFYIEGWVMPKATNTGTHVNMFVTFNDSTGVNSTAFAVIGDSSPPAGQWTKLSGYVVVPPGYDRALFTASVRDDNNTGDVFYWDDVVVSRELRPTDTFQANPQVYVSPDPVLPDPSGRIPATTLDNAIYAAAWTVQEHGTGGDHETRYADKVWTPIWRNYISQKGKLYFPQQINLKYLKCEFTKLTEEPYPVYDSGIQVSYKVFPASVTTEIKTKHPGLLGTGLGLLTIGADVTLTGIATVNFLNPATINNAVNSVFGQVRTPVSVTTGAGQVVTSLPNTTSLDVAAQTRDEVSSPYVYKRTPTSATTLAAQHVKTMTGQTNTQGGLLGAVGNLIGTTLGEVGDSFTPLVNFVGNPTGLPNQGSDWWVFPGATLRLPAIIMNGLTAVTQTILGRPSTITRERFNTTSVHRYDIKTVTRDAAVAYFAGVREIQPYVTTYIAELDPEVFQFDSYDPTQWVLSNTRALDSGPITTAGRWYEIENPQFDFGLANWAVSGSTPTWTADMSQGHWSLGTAHATANGHHQVLSSTFFDLAPGDDVTISAWVKWSSLVVPNGQQGAYISLGYYDEDRNWLGLDNIFATLSFSDWSTTHASSDWVRISASGTVPAGVVQGSIFVVTENNATAGNIWFDTIEVGPTADITATAFKDFITTSTFAKVKCNFTDSGLVRSDSMWTQIDPNDTNISHTSLAYYTSTIPDVIPAGMWGDTFADWNDETITWGAPRAVVAINVDPDRIFDGKRVLHFTRAGGAEEAGVKVRQATNYVANALFRIGAVFYKPYANTNQVTLRLRRVSDGVYIYEETFDPVVGYWYEHVTDFIEVPDTADQIYTVELVCTGDDPDEFYLNDLYTELAHIRYFVRLGDSGQFLHDVTQLRYADSAIVSTTTPVNEFSVQAAIMSPKAFAYSATIQPVYLK